MLAIRPAAAEDAAAIAHVHVESWRATYAGIVPQAGLDALNERTRTAEWSEWLTYPGLVLVATQDGHITGFAAGGAIREPLAAYDAELYTLYLLPGAQRQGTGSALLRELATGLAAEGFHSLVAWVFAANSSTGFYTRTGAVPIDKGEVEIAGQPLATEAYGWPSLAALATQR